MKIRLAILASVLLTGCGGSSDEQAGGRSEETAETSSAPAASPQVAAAPPAFAVCASCHAVTPGRQGVGPSLAGIWGRKAASQAGYSYSAALQKSGIVWDAQSLDQWLQAPIKMVPGTKMVIAMPNPEGRKQVIEYLETLK